MSSAGEDRCMAPAWVPLIKERGFVLEGKGSETWPGWYPQACLASFRQPPFHTLIWLLLLGFTLSHQTELSSLPTRHAQAGGT